MTPTRIVAVSYLNTIPFVYGMERGGLLAGAGHPELSLVHPAACADALASGAADVGLIPAAALLSLPDLTIITPYCIGATGAVRTVVVMSNSPISQIETLYGDVESRTSCLLARILCSNYWHISPQWRPLHDLSLLDTLPEGAGCVLIGDKVFAQEGRFRYSYDLSEVWHAYTSLPFAFALWVARPDVAAQIEAPLTEALSYGLKHIPEAIEAHGYGAHPHAEEYLTQHIDFVLDTQKRQALARFWEEGREVEPPSPS